MATEVSIDHNIVTLMVLKGLQFRLFFFIKVKPEYWKILGYIYKSLLRDITLIAVPKM